MKENPVEENECPMFNLLYLIGKSFVWYDHNCIVKKPQFVCHLTLSIPGDSNEFYWMLIIAPEENSKATNVTDLYFIFYCEDLTRFESIFSSKKSSAIFLDA
jgi:hypothetical protein